MRRPSLLSLSSLLTSLIPAARANFVAWYPSDLTTITSPLDDTITISYKTPDDGICVTAFDTQKQYTGWVNVPGDYPTNLFFWFVEARQQPANLTIWLNGGPGSSSLIGFFNENGPCEVIEAGLDQYQTVVRDWGWDRASNMLFVDQPNQVGFSYDIPTNGSIDYLSGDQYAPAQPQQNMTYPEYTWANGTFSSLNPNNAPNTTETAALAIWHMLQGFMSAFPQYSPPNNSSIGVNLFAESYGGKYGPIFAEVWEEQNANRLDGLVPASSTVDIRLEAVGIINGCVDDIIQEPYYPQMAVNNTYGYPLASEVQAALVNGSFWEPGGCYDLIVACRTAQSVYDPDNTGNVAEVNSACDNAFTQCYDNIIDPFLEAGRSPYDIAHPAADPFPPSTYLEYTNTPQFQAAIGAPVNFTSASNDVYQDFSKTGDWVRGGTVDGLADLLNKGIRVGLIYGDRDYICNWLGGEAISLALASTAGAEYAERFPAAGYEDIIVNDTYIGGVVRQFGNLSFSRIYQAGHSVPAYQPETAFQVFVRIMMGTALPDGKQVNLCTYNTTGPANATATNKLPDYPEPTCYIRAIDSTCDDDQVESIKAGEGVVINGVWYAASSDWPLATPQPSTTATTTTTQTLTGWFTATTTPKNSARGAPEISGCLILAILCLATASLII